MTKTKLQQMKSGFVSLVVIALLLSSCSGKVNNLKYMSDLRDTISAKYQIKDIEVKITNNNMITVSLVNSQYNDSSFERKQNLAIEIGEIVLQTQKDSLSFISGDIRFIQRKNYFVYHTTNAISLDMHLDSLSETVAE